MKHLILFYFSLVAAGLLQAQVTNTAAVIDTKRSDGTFVESQVTVLNTSVLGWSASGTLTRYGLGTGLSVNESGQLVAIGGSAATWGSITGTLSAQVDLQSALDTKLSGAAAASTYVALAGSYANPAWITSLAWSKITGTPTTLAGYGITDALTAATAASSYVSLTGSYADPAWITSLAWSKITGEPTFITGSTGSTDGAVLVADGVGGSTGKAAPKIRVFDDGSGYAVLTVDGFLQVADFSDSTSYLEMSPSTDSLTFVVQDPDTSTQYFHSLQFPSNLANTIFRLPTTNGTNGQVLTTNGSGLTSWSTAGTVTSVAVAGTDGIEVDSGSPITTAGTITLGVNPATLKTTLNLSGTNSGDVTLAGSLDYLTLAGQVITLGPIDLATDTTGSLAWASVSKTGSSLADLATRSASDLTSGTLDAARLPAPTTTTLGGVKRNAGSGTQFVSGIDSAGALTYAAQNVEIGVACSDETSNLTTGDGKMTFRLPHAMTLTAVRASVTTAPTGSTVIVDIKEGGTSVLGTLLSIDASEKTSTTAASAATITDSSLADDAEITIDLDQIGSSTAGTGLKVWLIGTRP